MALLVVAFFSGVLTVLAPCVLPLLPIILGASVENEKDKYTPYIIIASLSISILIFSILLKASTLFIGVPATFWKTFSGGLIIGLGIITIFPNLWKNISGKLGFSGGSNELLTKSSQKQGYTKYILMGFALGPVFSSCSPTYALILAIILPAGFFFGFIALISYVLGLAAILLAISLFGQKLIKNLKWASDPNGLFKKILGIVFVLVGLAILTGVDKKIEAKILDAGFLNTTNFEQSIIDSIELDEEESTENKDTSYIENNLVTSELTGQKCDDGSCGKEVEGSLSFLDPENILKKNDEMIVSEKGYKAPDLVGLTNWINSPEISSLEELKGQVVMIDFWTLGCINCINTHDETQKLYEEFKDEGFTVLGLHAPEFAYEKKLPAVKKAVQEFGITFPVAQDNDFETWRMYNNRYWPAFYLIDINGNVRYTHFGEGAYDEKRQAVIELLSEKSQTALNSEPLKKKQEFLKFNLTTNTAKSSIELSEVLDGGPGKDGIPAINNPKFISQKQALTQSSYLGEDDLGIVLHRGDEARFYGYDVLVWHEIVNDEINGEDVAVTFCPLCGSAIVYDRNLNGEEVNFGVSGKLYNSNLLMYDDRDETLWSQSLGEAVLGDQLGTKLEVVKSELMNYSEFQENFPNGVVLSNDTGHSRRYGQIPYGNYEENDDLYFPVNGPDDERFHSKELFYIVNDGDDSLAFAWNDLREAGKASITLGDDIYTASFSGGVADFMKNDTELPGYFEMWFSWINHNPGNKNIWSK